MPAFQRSHPQKFAAKGMSLSHAHDLLPVGKFPLLKNVRSYIGGVLETRPGMTALNNIVLADLNVHSIKRLVNDIPGATTALTRIVGAGANLYTLDGGVGTQRDTGYSGNPLSMIRYRPERSPEAYVYIADASRMRKIRADGADFEMGISTPTAPPTAVLSQPLRNALDDFESTTGWTQGGTAGAPSSAARYATTITRILFDSGVTGWASVQPASMAGFQTGARTRVDSGGADDEQVTVEEIFVAVKDTSIESILYDSGITGLCSIVLALPVKGWRPDMLVLLDSGGPVEEVVRVLSVTRGRDERFSFRCLTVNAQGAGKTVTGISSFRAYFTKTPVVTNTLGGNSVRTTLTGAGTGFLTRATARDFSVITSGRVTRDDDEIHLSIRVDDISLVTEGRLLLDVDSTTNDFTRNFLFFAFRANDLTPAIDETLTVVTTRQRAIQRDLIDRFQSSGAFVREPRTRQELIALDGFNIRDRRSIDIFIQERETQQLAVTGTRGAPSGIGTPSGQAVTGANQWFELRIKVSDLERVGADESRGLKDVASVRVSLQTTGTVVMDVDALWLGGGFGPDVGPVSLPYLYRYRGRSSVTGARSNASPALRSGVRPRRGRVSVSLTQHVDTQVDLLDVFRFGGVLAGWVYVGTVANSASPQFSDDFSDLEIASGDRLEFDNFQPFPTIDVPHSGTCDVRGTSVVGLTGDPFDINWLPGALINLGGEIFTLYRSPASATRLEIVEDAGTRTGVTFSIEQAVLPARAMPVMWGPMSGETAGFLFACGDTLQPGVVFITKGNSPDSAPETSQIELTSPSEPLMNGVIYDGRSYVFSGERMFGLYPSLSEINIFTPREIPNGKGLFSRWGLTVGPRIWFLGRDGIYETAGGEPVSITNEDLYEFFPGEGRAPRAVTIGTTIINPPDFSKLSDLRLSYYGSYLYFNYVDTASARQTLVYDYRTKGWFLDVYTPGIVTHYGEEGREIDSLLLGGADGKIYQSSGLVGDGGAAISCQILTPTLDLGDSRAKKLLGDIAIESDTKGVAVTVKPWLDDFETQLATTVLNTSALVQTIIDFSSGAGQLLEEISLELTWLSTTLRPQLHEWSPAFVLKPEDTFLRGTDWDDAGYAGAKFVQGVIIEADTGGVARTVEVQIDGVTTVLATLTVNHNGQIEAPFSFAPFVAHTLRLVPTDTNSWRLFKARWVWEPMPELATSWETQGTTHDLRGFQHLRDAYISLLSIGVVTLTITADGVSFVRTIPSTAGAHRKPYVTLPVIKGKQFVYKLTAAAGFRLFQRDCEVRVKAWGQSGPRGGPGSYIVVNPFGDVHREQGARI